MKLLLYIFTTLTINGFCQENYSKGHFIGMQFGGQSFVSFHYDYSIYQSKNFILLSDFGLGLNENADDSNSNLYPANYSMYHGLTLLSGLKNIYIETSILPVTYFNNATYLTLTGWVGISFINTNRNFYFSAGYTPMIYPSLDQLYINHLNAYVGLKAYANVCGKCR